MEGDPFYIFVMKLKNVKKILEAKRACWNVSEAKIKKLSVDLEAAQKELQLSPMDLALAK